MERRKFTREFKLEAVRLIKDEDWSAWRLNYNVFCHQDLPATFFDAWLAGAKENGQSAIAAMATREGWSFTWSECMREVNLSAKGRWVFDDLLFKYGMRDGFCCPIGPWILHYWSSKVLDLVSGGCGSISATRAIAFQKVNGMRINTGRNP